MQWQPDGLTIHAKKWFLGAGFLGAPAISLKLPQNGDKQDLLGRENQELHCSAQWLAARYRFTLRFHTQVRNKYIISGTRIGMQVGR